MAVIFLLLCFGFASAFNITNVRPAPSKRTFNSSLIDFILKELNETILPQPLGTLFGNCLPNTLDTTVLHSSSVPSALGRIWNTFVITGDIPAMWLRDSMNQVYPYVRILNASLAAGKPDHVLESFLFGVVHRQAASIMVDPYANAFAWWGPKGTTGANQGDQTYKEFEVGAGPENAMQDLRLYERKFEIDSLLSMLKLASGLLESTASDQATKSFLQDPDFIPAVGKILDTLNVMRDCANNAYTFQRQATEPTDTLSHGVGFPCRDTGMVRTHFRPSDDAVVYAFNIPGNAMAAVELARLANLLHRMQTLQNGTSFSYPWTVGLSRMRQQAIDLEKSIRAGIDMHGSMYYRGQLVFAYEVDGLGNAIFMDDANIPSLLSLPFLGFVDATDPMYRRTRSLVLSEYNPWFFKGSLGIGGVGGPHVGIGHIWPMSLMMQAWTSSDASEVQLLLGQLVSSSVPNSLMHESFNKDTFNDFTRKWFAWANTLFGDLVLKVASDPVLYRAAKLSKPLDLVALIKTWDEHDKMIIV